jgi:hypothetical protein
VNSYSDKILEYQQARTGNKFNGNVYYKVACKPPQNFQKHLPLLERAGKNSQRLEKAAKALAIHRGLLAGIKALLRLY